MQLLNFDVGGSSDESESESTIDTGAMRLDIQGGWCSAGAIFKVDGVPLVGRDWIFKVDGVPLVGRDWIFKVDGAPLLGGDWIFKVDGIPLVGGDWIIKVDCVLLVG